MQCDLYAVVTCMQWWPYAVLGREGPLVWSELPHWACQNFIASTRAYWTATAWHGRHGALRWVGGSQEGSGGTQGIFVLATRVHHSINCGAVGFLTWRRNINYTLYIFDDYYIWIHKAIIFYLIQSFIIFILFKIWLYLFYSKNDYFYFIQNSIIFILFKRRLFFIESTYS